MKRKCNVCGINWVVSENGDNICDECFNKFNMSGDRQIPKTDSKWTGQKFYTTGG